MTLTSDELTELDAYLKRRERQARSWRIARWAFIAGGIVLGIAACVNFAIAWQCYRDFCSADNPGAAIVDVFGLSIMFPMALLLWASFLIFCIGSAADWHKGKKDGLLVKLAQTYVDEQRQRLETPP